MLCTKSGPFFLRIEENVVKHLISGFIVQKIARIPLVGCVLLQNGHENVKILLNLAIKRGQSQTFPESL